MADKRKRRRGWWPLIVLTLLVLYVLSYAPVVHLRYGSNEHLIGEFAYFHDTSYAPVEWLIDYTPAKKPLMWWAEFWDVDQIVDNGAKWRTFYRKNSTLTPSYFDRFAN